MTRDEADPPLQVTPNTRQRAHRALDRWLEECERSANEQFERGCMGAVGDFKLRASYDDQEVNVWTERTVVEDL